MKRPLAAVVSFYAAGLLLAVFFHPPLPALFAVSGGMLALAVIFSRLRPWLLAPLLALAGWINLTACTAIISPQDLRVLLTAAPEQVSVRGRLSETPTQRVYVRDDVPSWRTLGLMQVTDVQRGTNWQAAHGQILVTTSGIPGTNFFNGQQVEITGVIAPPPIPVAEGLFDYRAYLRLQGVYFQLKTASVDDWKLLSTNTTPPLSDRFLAWSQRTLAHGLPVQDEPLGLLWAMTLGWKPALTGEVTAPFMESGTMHIFAISGLHIALIAGILAALLRAVQIPRFWCGFVIIPVIWFYTAATGWQPSAIRSTIMMTIIIGGWALRRPSNLINSLAAAAFIILIYDPQQLFQASFQLSFFVVLSIALFLPPLEKFRDHLLKDEAFRPPQLVPRWKRRLKTMLRMVSTSMTVSLAAWFGSWPLTAYYFHLFSPVTLLANLLVVPLSSAALACNLGSLVCGDWLPWVTELFNYSGWLWMKLMVDISRAVIELPGAFFYVKSPALADFVIYYGGLFAVLSGIAFQKRWRTWTMLGVVFIGLFYGWRWHETRQTTTLTVLPLNGGSGIFVQAGKPADDLLIDCGDTNAVEFITKPFLHAQGVNHLPVLALSHGGVHDMGGALPLCELFSIPQVITSPVKFRAPAYRKTIAELDQTPQRHRSTSQGGSIGNWTVLHPATTNHFPQADDNSLVLKADIHGARILLLSYLGRPGQEILLASTNDLRADIVVTSLPVKTEPLCDALLDVIQPKVIIVTDAEFPAMKRAPAALRDRLAARKIPVIYTRNAGAVTIVIKPGKWELRTMDGQKY